IGEDQLYGQPGLFHKGLADQVGTDVWLQSATVKDLLDAIRLDRRTETEFKRPTPNVDYEITTQVPGWLVQHCKEPDVDRFQDTGRGQSWLLAWVQTRFRAQQCRPNPISISSDCLTVQLERGTQR